MTEDRELLRRMEDLADRCERTSAVTVSGFLTPPEQQELTRWAAARPDIRLVLSGGQPGCERQAAFFLPYYMEPDDLDPSEYLRAVKLKSFFGEPGHRDYMGAILALGIRREWVGDIRVLGSCAYVFCMPSVEGLISEELTRAGRYTVKPYSLPLDEVPVPERNVHRLTFTVKSMRLDAVAGAMFGLSRTAAAELIRLGGATLNYEICLKTDAAVKQGDIISIRGKGKGTIAELGGMSRKDRIFLTAEIYM